MVIEKNINDSGLFDITIKDSNKVLSIYLSGDDHNLSCRYDDFKKISEIVFEISEEQSELYSIFAKLYNSIVSGNLLNGDLNNPDTIKSIIMQQSFSWFRDIVGNDGLTIISDATPITCPNTLKIRKEQDKIELVFMQVDGKSIGYPKNPYIINIHVRGQGSKLYDFCIPFKTLYNDLQNITPTQDIKMLKKDGKM